MKEICHDHSGCIKDIENLAAENTFQWNKIHSLELKVDGIMNRLNYILGGVVVACVMLALNLVIQMF